MLEKKRERRKGQKKPDGRKSVPKEVCPICKERGVNTDLVTAWKTKNRKWVRVGLVCPVDDCPYIIKDIEGV